MVISILAGSALVALASGSTAAAPAGGRDAPGSAEAAPEYGIRINVTCSLTLNPGGNFSFAAISGLTGSAAESTAENDAIASCDSPGPARLSITDASLTGTTTYSLTSGSHTIGFEICPTAGSPTGCYTNSSSGFPVVDNSTTKMFGYLPAQGKNAAGSYSDTISVTVTFP
jgi:spore coat protein U-like protein